MNLEFSFRILLWDLFVQSLRLELELLPLVLCQLLLHFHPIVRSVVRIIKSQVLSEVQLLVAIGEVPLSLVHVALKLFKPLLALLQLQEGFLLLSSERVNLGLKITVSLASQVVFLLGFRSLPDLILEVILDHGKLLPGELHHLDLERLEESGCDQVVLDGFGLSL